MANKPTDPSRLASAGDEAYRAMSRRRALKQLGLIAGGTAAAAYAGLAPPSWPLSLHDPDGERGKPVVVPRRLPEGGYAVEPSPVAAQLGVARGSRIAAMVEAALDAIGGIGRFISSGDVVLIKPNVAFERPAALAATTNPEVLSALIQLVRAAGAREVRVADNPIESPEACFARSGIRAAANSANARVFLPGPSAFATVQVPGAKWIGEWPFFWEPFRGVDKVIGVSPVKDHNLCRASMTTKNWYGLLGGRRNQFHQDIHGIITDLALMMKPTFVMLDATRILYRSGPTGGSLDDVKLGNTIVASADSIAVDAYGWDELLERSGEDKPAYLHMCNDRGLGVMDWKSLRLEEIQVG
jgi:uncharacterized protein (DUF362 family)